MNAYAMAIAKVRTALGEIGTGAVVPKFVPPSNGKRLSNEATAKLHDEFNAVWEYAVAMLGASYFEKRKKSAKEQMKKLGLLDACASIKPGTQTVLWSQPPLQLECQINSAPQPKVDHTKFVTELRKRGVSASKIDAAEQAALVHLDKGATYITVAQMGA